MLIINNKETKLANFILYNLLSITYKYNKEMKNSKSCIISY